MKKIFILGLLSSFALFAACKPKTDVSASSAIYALKGEVVKVLPESNTILVTHEAVEGLMPAMTMEFVVDATDTARLRPGQRVKAKLVQTKPGAFELRDIETSDRAQMQLVEGRAKELRQDTLIRGKGAYREIGEESPQFALLNQDGVAVDFSSFRGKQVVMNFIYSRCPILTMCPAATSHMIELQRLAKEKGVKNLQLVSISFDPAYDTPAVLKEYAKTRGIDTSNFSFLTGPERAVRDLLIQFGVTAEREENIIKHSLATILFDANGRIVHRVDGTKWDVREFAARLSTGKP